VAVHSNTLRVWDLKNGQIVRSFKIPSESDELLDVITIHGGLRALLRWADGTLRIWDPKSGRTSPSIPGDTQRFGRLAPDGRRFVTFAYDGALSVWDLDSGQTLCRFQRYTKFVRYWVIALMMTRDGLRSIWPSTDGILRLCDLENGQTLRTFEGHTSGIFGISGIAVTSDCRRVVSTSYDDETSDTLGI
jgi:WD40 repeat protein